MRKLCPKRMCNLLSSSQSQWTIHLCLPWIYLILNPGFEVVVRYVCNTVRPQVLNTNIILPRPSWTLHSVRWRLPVTVPPTPLRVAPPLEGRAFLQSKSFHFFLAFSQNTEDQVHLGSVTQGRHRYHPTPHMPVGNLHLRGGKPSVMQSPKFLGTTQALSQESRRGRPKTFWLLYTYISLSPTYKGTNIQ